jgi:hypothetical protein
VCRASLNLIVYWSARKWLPPWINRQSTAVRCPSKQQAYQNICVDPAHQQLGLLAPKMNRLGRQLQAEVQKYGGSLPREFLQAIGQ